MTTTTTTATPNIDTDVIDSNSKLLGIYGTIGDDSNGNGKSKRKNKKQDNNNDNKAIAGVGENTKRPFYIQKYSKDVPLLEAVIINRQPFFLQVIVNNNNGEPVLVDKFELNDIILYPKETHSYSNEPVAFKCFYCKDGSNSTQISDFKYLYINVLLIEHNIIFNNLYRNVRSDS